MRKYILSITLILTTLIACNDDFLDRAPINSQTEGTAFNTYTNFQSYAWSLYGVFTNTGLGTQGIHGSQYRFRGDASAGYLNGRNDASINGYGFNTVTVPENGGGWSFGEVRRANIMLHNIDKSELTDTEKLHWEGVGRFFRAYNYVELISRFGDVPWLDRAAENENDEEIVYAAQTPRVTVADNIVKDLEFAIENIKEDGDGKNTINPDCARVMLSRFGLFEGTWRKYHQTDETNAKFKAQDLLTKSKDVSLDLITKYPDIDPHFNGKYLQLSLANKLGIILYKEYTPSILFNNMGRSAVGPANAYETHQAIVDMYLCTDGKPIGTSSLYEGRTGTPPLFENGAGISPYHDFRNRDPRLLLSFVPPYFDKTLGAKKNVYFNPPAGLTIDPWEYKSIMEQLNEPQWSLLPATGETGKDTAYSHPNIQAIAVTGLASWSGYTFSRHYSRQDNLGIDQGNLDKPIFFIEEVMLNYAEVMAELGLFNDGVASLTINKLRSRVGVSELKVADITNDFDPNKDPNLDPNVTPVLWEIRRERMVEMMGEGFGFNDIKRWKTAPWFINRPFMGFYMRISDYTDEKGESHKSYTNIVLTTDGSPSATKLTEGYVYRNQNPVNEGKGWKEAYYLHPVPSTQLLLNPKLKQNPGWENL